MFQAPEYKFEVDKFHHIMPPPFFTLLACLPKKFVMLKTYYIKIFKTEATFRITDNIISRNIQLVRVFSNMDCLIMS
jgi:hypothetical protein